MKKNVLFLFLFFLTFNILFAQNAEEEKATGWQNYLHVETGFFFPSGVIKNDIALRQNVGSYYNHGYNQNNPSSSGSVTSFSHTFFMGVRYEYFSSLYRAGVSTGLRLAAYNTEISGYTSNADFFYLRYSMSGGDTKFAKVKTITEKNNIITVPVELRYFPVQTRFFGLFAKAGVEFSLVNINPNTEIVFFDNKMDAYHNDVLASFDLNTNNFYSTFYGSIGAKFGFKDKLNYMFEVFIPSYYLTSNNFVLSDYELYSGFKFSLQYPF